MHFIFKIFKLKYVIHNILDDQTHNWKVQADIEGWTKRLSHAV